MWKANKINNVSIKNDEFFFGINSITSASLKDITFYNDYKYLSELKYTKAKACLITKNDSNLLPKSCIAIIVDNPYLCFAYLSNLFKDVSGFKETPTFFLNFFINLIVF